MHCITTNYDNRFMYTETVVRQSYTKHSNQGNYHYFPKYFDFLFDIIVRDKDDLK